MSYVFQKPGDVAKFIDHTLLKADADRREIEKLCNEALDKGFYALCVNPCRVKRVARLLENKPVKICTVIGFPLGADSSDTKVYQAKSALETGAHELDMVVNIGAVKDREYKGVEREIIEVKKAAGDRIVKVIIETCFLNYDEKVTLCNIAKESGADFIKTSTGFGSAGATITDVKLIRKIIGPDMGVKAAGGIGDFETFKDMVEAGANRIGSSNGIRILHEFVQKYQEEDL